MFINKLEPFCPFVPKNGSLRKQPSPRSSPLGTSAPKRQKFHTYDVQSVRNLVRSSDWPT